ncbi:MAG: hypothetical protein IPN97_12635 [Saprospiraceae bacterium]|nr:hypothetical protein [Saprospiraceae bacterium]MBK9044000.1 hypothetical protein [Saprospiraceae bacterium]
MLLKKYLLFTLLVLCIQLSYSQDKIFINHGFWDVASNWSPAGVPTSTQTVGIGSNYTCTIPAGYMAECAGLILTTNADIIIQHTGTLTVIATQIIFSPIRVYGGSTITNAGEIHAFGLMNTALILEALSTLTNQTTGIININKSNIGFASSGTVHNHGVINVGNTNDAQGSGLSLIGNFTNYQNASILIHKSSGVGIGSSGNFINQGTCQIAISGTVSTGIFVTTPFLNDTTGTITINSSINNGFNSNSSSAHVTNKGTISISYCNYGLTALFTNTNIGTISINNCTRGISLSYSGSASSNAGTIHIGNTGNISAYGIFQENNADLTNTGFLYIDNANFGMGINNPGTQFTNSGTVTIGNNANIGTTGIELYTSAILTNNIGGVIEINRCTGYAAMAIANFPTLNNSGTIKMGNLQNIGGGIISWWSSQITNTSTGIMEINRSSWVGILVDQSGTLFNNSGTITGGNLAPLARLIYCQNGGDFNNTISGTINGNDLSVLFIGIDGSGTSFNNTGLITGGNTASIAEFGIHILNNAIFSNLANGSMTINRVNGFWWSRAISVVLGVFNNSGSIQIGNIASCGYGVYVEDDFNNNAGASIHVDNISGAAVVCHYTTCHFQNWGNIVIGNSTSIGAEGVGVHNNSLFVNHSSGTITVNRANIHWYSAGVRNSAGGIVNNSGSINIGNVIYCSRPMVCESNFNNLATGNITINTGTYSAIELVNTSHFQNSGNIIIGNVTGSSEYGIRIDQNSTFTNNSTGDVEINRINFYWWSKAIYIPVGTLNNSGDITIGNLFLCSFGIYYDDDFNNLAGGNITINRITYSGIESHNVTAAGTNNGNINIGNNVGCGYFGMSIVDNSTFVNQSGGIIEINNATTNWHSAGVFVKTALFTNGGIIRFGTIANLNLGIQLGENTTDTGTFINNGTLEFDRISDFNRAAIFCDVNTIFTNNPTGIIKFGYSQPVQIAFRGGGTTTNFGQLLCKNIAFSTVMTGQTLYNKTGSTFKVFAGFTNYIDGTLMQATGGIFIVDGTLYNFGTVIGTVN